MSDQAPFEEVVIAGGGLAGASAACVLAEAGRPVVILEREAKPHHKVCGEFLSIEAQAYLAGLGLDLDQLGASPIASLRLVHGKAMAEVDLPFRARGLSRKVLDEALLREAVARSARLTRSISARSISPTRSGLRIDVGGSRECRARTLFLAIGKHDARGVKRPNTGIRGDLIGFKAHYFLAASQRATLEGVVEVILFAGGYIGLQMIEDGVANLCLLVSRHCFEQAGKSWDSLLDYIFKVSPHLARRLDGAVATFPRPLSIFRIPFGFVHAHSPAEPPGLFRLGDQVGVIPSFTGDGMSIALHSGCLAASMYLSGQSTSAFHMRVRDDIRRQVWIASCLYEFGRQSAGQLALVKICQAWPMAIRYIASMTRVQETALERALLRP